MDYIIGVDGGGTKTEATAYNLEDEVIANNVAGPGNPAVDFNGTIANITQAITQCMQEIKSSEMPGECKGIYLGLAGIEIGNNMKRVEAAIGLAFQCQVVCIHDSELAYAAMLQGQDGIITIAGTGSVCYGRYRGKADVVGGWGHVLGDEGSGYWIALAAMKLMTLEQDSGVQASLLSTKMMEYLGVASAAGMKEFVHSAGKNQIAEAARVVDALAKNGNTDALKILDQAGSELAKLTIKLYKKLEIEGSVVVGVSGGILCNIKRVRAQFQWELEQNLDGVIFLKRDISPTKGACYLHRQLKDKSSR